jgi:hypothetical protein
MTIVVERLPEEPIIVAVWQEPMDFRTEVPEMFQQVLALRDTIEDSDRYFLIMDISSVKVSFSDVVYALGESRVARDQRRADLPLSLLLVGSGPLLELAAKAMSQAQYGGYGMRLCASMEDALAAVRTAVAA